LIAPQWVITAAHAVSWQSGPVTEVCINGIPRRVERVVIHPGYKTMPQELITQALAGDRAAAIAHLASSDDIALLRLAEPVTDVAPALLHRDGAELGRTGKIVGRGATGVGSSGHNPNGPNRTQLRRAFNEISAAEGRWINYVFDAPPAGLALEGMSGNGDSGGPVLIEANGRWELAGLAAWKFSDDDAAIFRPAAYGQTSYNVRISHYAEWIERVMSAEE
ncbi:MAG TPA: trypsin-like serine protease, partial [Terricaulis sp.]|nr:trypsin-like serine protease [Terricaulis sp.]